MRITRLGLLVLSLAIPAFGQANPRTKKGLQVQMVDDALELGISHATLNVQLGDLLTADPSITDSAPLVDGVAIAHAALARLDRQVRPLAAAGVELNFILLARATRQPRIDALLLHPDYDAAAPNSLGAFRVADAPGRALLRGLLECLGRRYGPTSEVGYVRGWIVGNEINSHWWWYNLGRAPLEGVVAAYEPAVRIVHEVASSGDPNARVYISLEHHWGQRYAPADETQACGGRAFLDAFARRVRERGDFAWHVAYHPYPEDLFDCRFWDDETAESAADTPRITFKNLEVLTQYLQRDELSWRDLPRRVILSEQGFHCRDGIDGERDQAAAFALAWQKVGALDGIDAFIYHRHVDHAHEGGLRLGLWTNRAGSIAAPDRKRLIWKLLRDCDTPAGAPELDAAIRRATSIR